MEFFFKMFFFHFPCELLSGGSQNQELTSHNMHQPTHEQIKALPNFQPQSNFLNTPLKWQVCPLKKKWILLLAKLITYLYLYDTGMTKKVEKWKNPH